MDVMNFVSLLEKRVEQFPQKVIYRFIEPHKPEQTITYQQLYERVLLIASTLREQKLTGARVLLAYSPGFEFIAALLGCFAAQVIAVPAYPPVSKRTAMRLENIMKDCGARVILSTSSSRSRIEKNLPPGLEARLLCSDLFDLNIAKNIALPRKDDLAFLQYTSGSTSGIKGVKINHENLLHNSQLIKESMQLGEDDVFINWLPQFHDMGLIGGILQSLYSNFEDVLFSPFEFIKILLYGLN